MKIEAEDLLFYSFSFIYEAVLTNTVALSQLMAHHYILVLYVDDNAE